MAPSLYRATAAITIRATPEAAFDAWLDPRQAARFLAAHATTVGEFTNDPHEGGGFRLVMQAADERREHSGRYVVIERPRRLVFTWISAGTDHRLSLVTVVFTPADGAFASTSSTKASPTRNAPSDTNAAGTRSCASSRPAPQDRECAMSEATIHDIRFPNESREYRAARDKLLAAEITLRRQIEEVAAERRALPPGGRVAEDYVFVEGDDAHKVRLSELFGDKSVLLLYRDMYGPAMAQPCPSCTSILDGLDGQVRHIEQRAAVARSPIARVCAVAQERGWRRLRLLSSSGNGYRITTPTISSTPLSAARTGRSATPRIIAMSTPSGRCGACSISRPRAAAATPGQSSATTEASYPCAR